MAGKLKSGVDVDRALDAVKALIPKAAILEGHQLDGVALTTEFKPIPHKLGRRIRGYVVVGQRDAEATTYEFSVGAHAMLPSDDADWARPSSAGTDYYRTLAAARIAIPITCLKVGDVITGAGLTFWRNAGVNPSVTLYAEDIGAATAAAVTPTVAWTNPSGSGAWGTLTASYSAAVTRGAVHLSVLANNIGDRVRSAYVTVEPATPVAVVTDDSAGKADLATNIHLRASTPVTVDLWVY